jgi:hypothetical protein
LRQSLGALLPASFFFFLSFLSFPTHRLFVFFFFSPEKGKERKRGGEKRKKEKEKGERELVFLSEKIESA